MHFEEKGAVTGLAKQGDGFVRGGDIEQLEVLLRTLAQLELARGRRLRAFANPPVPFSDRAV